MTSLPTFDGRFDLYPSPHLFAAPTPAYANVQNNLPLSHNDAAWQVISILPPSGGAAGPTRRAQETFRARKTPCSPRETEDSPAPETNPNAYRAPRIP